MPDFKIESCEYWGSSENGKQLILTENKYIWELQENGTVKYKGELI
jgi:hypothetical protein